MDSGLITHEYRLLRSSWGIRIGIAATVLGATHEKGDSSNRLVFTSAAADLPTEYKAEMAVGFARCEAAITGQALGEVVVDVERVTFVEADFQIEGLSVAMCRWTELAFSLPPRVIGETFIREENRYVFVWG